MSSGNGQSSLIKRARSGDRTALEELLSRYSPQLTAHIAHRLPPTLHRIYGAEDVTQAALTNAFLRIHQLRGTTPQAFSVWLKAVGERTLMDLIRYQRRQKRGGKFRRVEPSAGESVFDIVPSLRSELASGSQQAARHEALRALQVSIASLATDQRRAIELHLLQQMTLEETARTMGRSIPAIRGLVARGKKNLAEAMGCASAWLSTT